MAKKAPGKAKKRAPGKATKKASRDTYKYVYPDGYAGITNDPKRRAGEQRRAGRQGKMKIVGRRVPRPSALGWERGYYKKKGK